MSHDCILVRVTRFIFTDVLHRHYNGYVCYQKKIKKIMAMY